MLPYFNHQPPLTKTASPLPGGTESAVRFRLHSLRVAPPKVSETVTLVVGDPKADKSLPTVKQNANGAVTFLEIAKVGFRAFFFLTLPQAAQFERCRLATDGRATSSSPSTS